MTTTPSPSPPSDQDTVPEDRRTGRLVTVLALPILLAPAGTAGVVAAAGVDPFPWDTVATAGWAASLAALIGGMAVLAIRPLAVWFGVPWFGEPDERTSAIWYRASAVGLGVTWTALIGAGIVTTNMTMVACLYAGQLAFYLSMLVIGRRI